MTEAEILRKALAQFLVQEGNVESYDPFADLIGMFEGSTKVDHDDVYLYPLLRSYSYFIEVRSPTNRIIEFDCIASDVQFY